MDTANVLYLTPDEASRVQDTLRDLSKKCRKQRGEPREARNRKGEIQQAVSMSLFQDLSLSFGGGRSNNSMVAYTTGEQYPPCLKDVSQLEPMELSELRMDTHHRGKKLILRRVSPVVELQLSSWTVVQTDQRSEDVERLEIFIHKSHHGQDVLEAGIEYVVKDPYYTLNSLGECTLRVDHPSDLVITIYMDNLEVWRSAKVNPAKVVETAEECKTKGNAALEKKDYCRAYAYYSEGLAKAGSNEGIRRDLHCNRSHVNLALLRYDEARRDADASLIRSSVQEDKYLDAKAYFRAGGAAYKLGQFEDAKSFFEEQLKLQPDNQKAKVFLKIDLRVKEKTTGVFDFNKAISSLSKTQHRLDLASFDGPTQIKESPGAGRGLFATRDIQPNEIILVEKAFCVIWSWDRDAMTAITCDLGNDAAIKLFPTGLHRAVVRKLRNNPSQIQRLLELASTYKGLGVEQHWSDEQPVVDAFQVHDIIQQNAFGPGAQSEDEDVSNTSTGIWLRAAYMNHSCVFNATKVFIGDILVLRSNRKIKAGEEITHCYDARVDVDDRNTMLQKTWQFSCSCALCQAERKDSAEVRKKRKDLVGEISSFMQRERALGARAITVMRAKRLRAAVNATYDRKRYEGLPKLALFSIDEWLRLAGK
ncbi:tpr domain-containing protein [Penicillium concentricum]|uniref:Tpr domain-containing protein n=1 Tax=Penicillium concentricum TaxID=293559 RepID=A0A9W9RAG1_9EURO|nr:tpr domain-containing protein [Penicillium concentricum]KAJ5356672.1 tpr domain-containing protein [Penicillium concentricum]